MTFDTQHGTFEKVNKRGKHIDEFDKELNPQNKQDNAGALLPRIFTIENPWYFQPAIDFAQYGSALEGFE